MNIRLHLEDAINFAELRITGSKSETNRLLLLKALYPGIEIKNSSESDDSEAMRKALSGNAEIIDIHHAGTAMRFLTAYFAMQKGREVVLTGSPRMKERPISVLVDALRTIGADIQYIDREGYPPLKIKGRKLTGKEVSIDGGISSQYITSLLLIGPKLENGLELTLTGNVTSQPYIKMTLQLLRLLDINAQFNAGKITIPPKPYINVSPVIMVESDWSSASYFYAIMALSPLGTSIKLSSFRKGSLQGDSAVETIYKKLGVTTTFVDAGVLLEKTSDLIDPLYLNLQDTPDIAQTIAVTCLGLGIACNLTGLHTLKIKETDRLHALKTEMEKLGASVSITENSLELTASLAINNNVAIDTYSDHRMAMAFAPIALKVPIVINNAEVVSKSYPLFWDDLKKLGFKAKVL